MKSPELYFVKVLLKGKVKLHSTEEGGRLSAAKSGYQPQAMISDEQTGIVLRFIGTEWLAPGETTDCELHVSLGAYKGSAIAFRGSLEEGQMLPLREGYRKIGEFKIHSISKIKFE